MDISRTACSLLVAAWAAQPGASQEIPKLDYIISGDVQAVARDTADQNQSRTELAGCPETSPAQKSSPSGLRSGRPGIALNNDSTCYYD